MGAVVASTRADGRCLYANREFTRITGYTLTDIPTVGDWLQKAYPDEQYREQILANWARDVDPVQMGRDVVYEVTRRDGERRHIQFRASRLAADRMVVMLLDVTERDLAEQQLRLRDRAIEACADAIAVADLDFRISYVNPAFLALWGYGDESEVVGCETRTFWADPEKVAALHEAILRDGRWADSMEAKRRDGSAFSVWASVSVVPDAADEPHRVVAWFTDLTERNSAQTALAVSRSQLLAAIESVPFDLSALDSDGRYILQNSASRAQWGDVVGKRPEDLDTDLATLAIWEENNRRVLAGETVKGDVEFVVRGQRRQFHNIVSPIRVDGEVQGILGVNIDITEQRQAEEREKEIQARLRQAERMDAIGQLAGGVAHDFNNILTAVNGSAELLHDVVADDPDGLELVTHLTVSVQRAIDLTAKLLSFARRGTVLPVELDVHAVIREVERLLARTLDRRLVLTLDLRADRPTVMADSAQLETALLNLGLNARDAMPDGGTITFATRTRRVEEAEAEAESWDVKPGTYVEIRVRDMGCGMSSEVQTQAFEPFFTTKGAGNTGLGLSAVYGCVQSHGGGIKVDSTPSKGTTVSILLPLHVSETRPGGIETDTKVVEKGNGRVLVVDDETVIRRLASRSLERLGYHVDLCADGQEAIGFYREHGARIDLVVLDLVMPKMDGAQTFRELKRIDPSVRVLLCSGYSRNRTVETLINEGATGFLSKPFGLGELARRVGDCLSRVD